MTQTQEFLTSSGSFELSFCTPRGAGRENPPLPGPAVRTRGPEGRERNAGDGALRRRRGGGERRMEVLRRLGPVGGSLVCHK